MIATFISILSYLQVLPIALLIMAVVTFKTGMVAEMFNWSLTEGYIYLPSWVREIGSMMQVMPLLVIPFVGIIQSCRYFLHGPDNLLEVSHARAIGLANCPSLKASHVGHNVEM